MSYLLLAEPVIGLSMDRFPPIATLGDEAPERRVVELVSREPARYFNFPQSES